MMIEHIDAIARRKQRGVLFVEFHPEAGDANSGGVPSQNPAMDWTVLPIRQQVIAWLEAHGIAWEPCGHFANLQVMMGYKGQIYIDVPFEPALPAYCALADFLENPDGTVRFPETVFGFCPLETAMKNAAHDEPGTWEKWADDF